jgi:hypothetical protein
VQHEIPNCNLGGGGLSRCEWVGVYFLVASKDRLIEPIVSTLARLTCPVVILGSRFPVSLYSALVANVATYALVGLVVEALRRRFNNSN